MRKASCLALLLGVTACGEPSGMLSISIQDLPTITNQDTLTIQGAVSRVPEAQSTIVATVSLGFQAIADTVDALGNFSALVTLLQNQENEIRIDVIDEQGSTGGRVVTVLHDNVGPAINQITPSSRADSVPLNVQIQVRFDEPLFPGSATPGFELRRNTKPVAGGFSVSPDSATITYTPAGALAPNAVYEMRINFTDQSGNVAGAETDACFVTTPAGFPIHVASDTADLGWVQGNPEPTLTDPNITTVQLVRSRSTLFGLIKFAANRVFARLGDSSATLLIEIDADQDSTTGVRALRDTIFTNFPEVQTGMLPEFVLGLEPNSALGDSAYFGSYSAPFNFDTIDTFLPGVCGSYYGFDTDGLFGAAGEEGNFDYAIIAFAAGLSGNILDIMPEDGHFTASLASPGPAVSGAQRTPMNRWERTSLLPTVPFLGSSVRKR